MRRRDFFVDEWTSMNGRLARREMDGWSVERWTAGTSRDGRLVRREMDGNKMVVLGEKGAGVSEKVE